MAKTTKKNPEPTQTFVWCSKRGCGRFTIETAPDWEWWLSGEKFGGDPMIIRCPQHITEWTMRLAGMGRGMNAYRFKRQASENDPYGEVQHQLGFGQTFLLY